MEPGPGTAWLRLRCPVVAGEALVAVHAWPPPPTSAAASAIRCATRRHPGINADITISLHRHPVGEWICLESGAWVQPHGVGLAETRLHDERGPIGQAMQSLLIEPIDVRPSPATASPVTSRLIGL